MTAQNPRARTRESFAKSLWPVLAIVFLISLYPFLRYGVWWNIGNDTLIFTDTIRSVLETGELVSADRSFYPNGYGYQALSVFLLNLSGVDLPSWQFYGGVFLIIWMIIPAWLLYREWVGTNRGAMLSTIFLFTQPELLFGIMRGTHEKFTRGLILLSLYLLTYSLRSRHNSRRFVASLLAFYLSIYAQITFNNLFSTSFLAAVILALGLAWGFSKLRGPFPAFEPARQRLAFAILASLVLVFVFIFYIYSPARDNLVTLKTITDRIAALILGVEPESRFNPYAEPVFRAWVSPYIFFLLNVSNWLLLLGAVTLWISQSARWLLRRQHPSGNAELLQWAFCGSFVLLFALSILADLGGAISGNLQHRLFPTLGLIAAPFIARWLLPFLEDGEEPNSRLFRFSLWAVVGLLSILALLKATNDPVLSNQWQTLLPAELAALNWAEDTLTDRSVWNGFDRRLVEAVHLRSGAIPRPVILDRFEVEPETDNYLVSDLIRLQVPRLGVVLPIQFDDLITYDNGQTQIYHRRPRTPYQR